MKSNYLKAIIFVVSTNLFFLLNSVAFAQTLPNVLGDPHYGSIEFGNTSSNSISQEISAGGSFDLAEMNTDYSGYISSIPDIQLTYSAGNSELTFMAESNNTGDDPILLIFSPSGEFLFNDDIEQGGYDAEITIKNPESGNYAIWVGNYDAEELISTLLTISENSGSGSNENSFVISSASFDQLDVFEDPYYGDVHLESGFMPDPYIKTITAGGSVDLSQYGHTGYSGRKPDIDFYFTPSGNTGEKLTISVQSETDTILLINGPEETWYFSDDADGTNPAIIFSNPNGGLYSIFVGTFDSGTAEAELMISEL